MTNVFIHNVDTILDNLKSESFNDVRFISFFENKWFFIKNELLNSDVKTDNNDELLLELSYMSYYNDNGHNTEIVLNKLNELINPYLN